MISAEQLRVFEEQGAVTIDTPLTTKEIAAAAAAIDALLPFKSSRTGPSTAFSLRGDLQLLRAGPTGPDPASLL